MTAAAQGSPAKVASLIMDLQSLGLRVEAVVETRRGGAGPSDSGMLWIEGVPVTVPTQPESPYVLKDEDDGHGIYRDGHKVASATTSHRPRWLRGHRPPLRRTHAPHSCKSTSAPWSSSYVRSRR